MMRIVLVEGSNLEIHRLRDESRRAGLSLVYASAHTRLELERLLTRKPGAVVADMRELADLSLSALLDMTEAAGVPVVLLGGDDPQERALLAQTRMHHATLLRRSRMNWLPIVIDRVAGNNARSAVWAPMQVPGRSGQMGELSDHMRRVQKLALFGTLSASIAHEINNPLEAITNLIYIISTDEHIPDHLRAYLSAAEQELARVGHIAKQTLSFHREAETPTAVMPSDLLEEVLGLYTRKLQEKHLSVDRQYLSEEPLMLFSGEMRQVFANLIANAVDATGQGGRIAVRVHTARRFTSANAPIDGIRITIADSGCGIPTAARPRLGEIFYTTKGQRGNGLGLWVSQAIVKQHNGDMQLRTSTAPSLHGTTFSIFLPKKARPRVVQIGLAASDGTDEVPPQERIRLRASSH